MDEIVKKILDEAKAKENEAIELANQKKKEERDKYLVSLGLIKEGKERKWSETFGQPYVFWDEEKKMYYYDAPVPVEVTEEEFAEIQKYAKFQNSEGTNSTEEDLPYDNGAERALNSINKIMLALAIVGGIVMFFFALGIDQKGLIIWALVSVLGYVIVWAFVKVYINISNNLHSINYKLEKGKE